MGRIILYIMGNKTCSKPPTSHERISNGVWISVAERHLLEASVAAVREHAEPGHAQGHHEGQQEGGEEQVQGLGR